MNPFDMELAKLEAEERIKVTRRKLTEEKKRKVKDLRKMILLKITIKKTEELLMEIRDEEIKLWGHLDLDL
jgi:hypothetical protein